MQESVGFDLEHQPARPIAPARFGDAAAVIVMRRRRTQYGEGAEAVLTLEVGGRRIQSAPLEGLPECELVPTTKRRIRRLRPCRRSSCTVGSLHCTARETRPAFQWRRQPIRRLAGSAFNAAELLRASHRSRNVALLPPGLARERRHPFGPTPARRSVWRKSARSASSKTP